MGLGLGLVAMLADGVGGGVELDARDRGVELQREQHRARRLGLKCAPGQGEG